MNYSQSPLFCRSDTEVTKLIQFCFFFFQAEDGIRDKLVTGVQTCALPIYFDLDGLNHVGVRQQPCRLCGDCVSGCNYAAKRSEERRVGKECRSRWSPYH